MPFPVSLRFQDVVAHPPGSRLTSVGIAVMLETALRLEGASVERSSDDLRFRLHPLWHSAHWTWDPMIFVTGGEFTIQEARDELLVQGKVRLWYAVLAWGGLVLAGVLLGLPVTTGLLLLATQWGFAYGVTWYGVRDWVRTLLHEAGTGSHRAGVAP